MCIKMWQVKQSRYEAPVSHHLCSIKDRQTTGTYKNFAKYSVFNAQKKASKLKSCAYFSLWQQWQKEPLKVLFTPKYFQILRTVKKWKIKYSPQNFILLVLVWGERGVCLVLHSTDGGSMKYVFWVVRENKMWSMHNLYNSNICLVPLVPVNKKNSNNMLPKWLGQINSK